MRRERASRTLRWLVILLLAMVGAMLLVAPARAAARTPHATSDTLTLSIDNGTSFVYGETPQPTFTAVVVFATKPKANYFWQVYGKLEDGEPFGTSFPPTSSSDGMTLTFTRMTSNTPFTAGHHTAVATFTNPDTNATVTSNAISLTVNKATPSLTCGIDGNPVHFEGAGQTLHISMSPTHNGYPNTPVDWQNGTYSVTFDGPSHLAYPNLTPDSNDGVTVTGPSQIGKYVLGCTFSGTGLFTSATGDGGQPYTFSALHGLGSEQLFTNPTTLTAHQNLDFYVVLHAAPGLPTPTGQFAIYIGPYYTNSIQIDPSGATLVQLNPLASLNGVSKITVEYWGDIYYNTATNDFPLANPPIPSGGQGGAPTATPGQATPATTGTATPDSGATATPAGGVALSATETPSAGANTSPAASISDSGSPVLIIALLVILVILLSGAAGLALFLRRGKVRVGANSSGQTSNTAGWNDLANSETLPTSRWDS